MSDNTDEPLSPEQIGEAAIAEAESREDNEDEEDLIGPIDPDDDGLDI